MAVISGLLALSSCEDLLPGKGDDARDLLVDAWRVTENPAPGKSADEVYWVDITRHPLDTARIIISNFYNIGANSLAEAVLSGMTLTLPSQLLPGGFIVSGSGDIAADWVSIDWIYNVDDGSGQHETFTAEYQKLE